MSPTTASSRSLTRLLFIILAAFSLVLSLLVTVRPVLGGEVGDQGTIAIFKTMCDSFGQQDTCNGRDTSLDGYHIDYTVTDTETDQLVQTVVVTLGENAGGGGNTGDGSQGRAQSEPLDVGEYRVCEAPENAPIAYLEGEDDVPLDALPRPEPGNGGSSGGGQTQDGDCIVVTITAGTSELKFLNQQLETEEPTLVIDKEADTEEITVTDGIADPAVVTWTLTYTLTNGPVHNAVITDEVPDGFTFLDASDPGEFADGTVMWTFEELTASGSVSFRTTVDVATISRTAPTVNTAIIVSDETPEDDGEDSVTVTDEGELGGNPTPTPPDLPDTAALGAYVQVPATVLSLLLLASLAAMLYVRLGRQR